MCEWVCVGGRERESVCVYMIYYAYHDCWSCNGHVYVRVCACVCVRKREREREKERGCVCVIYGVYHDC